MPLPPNHGSPFLAYDHVGFLEWGCTCNSAERTCALTPYDAICAWRNHADSSPANHHNPTSPHVLVIMMPFLRSLGRIRASCDACNFSLGTYDHSDIGYASAFADFKRHV